MKLDGGNCTSCRLDEINAYLRVLLSTDFGGVKKISTYHRFSMIETNPTCKTALGQKSQMGNGEFVQLSFYQYISIDMFK